MAALFTRPRKWQTTRASLIQWVSLTKSTIDTPTSIPIPTPYTWTRKYCSAIKGMESCPCLYEKKRCHAQKIKQWYAVMVATQLRRLTVLSYRTSSLVSRGTSCSLGLPASLCDLPGFLSICCLHSMQNMVWYPAPLCVTVEKLGQIIIWRPGSLGLSGVSVGCACGPWEENLRSLS